MPNQRRKSFVFASDLDRTLTGPDLIPSASALTAIEQLRAAGHTRILVTGRPAVDVARYPTLVAAFDAFVLEGGAVWGKWDNLQRASNGVDAIAAGKALAEGGVTVHLRTASFMAPQSAQAMIRRQHPTLMVHVNANEVDVLPAGHDKATGLHKALQVLGIEHPYIVAIGDNDNDVALLQVADEAIAVANATPRLRAVAHRVMQGIGPAGVVELVQDLLAVQA